ncbi:MAG: glycosyltransferase family 2 protein [Myxococcota bacterium]
MHLSVVVPCFNEEGNIADVVRSAAEVGRNVATRLEIVVVDDGSTDGTASLLADLQARVPELTTVHHSVNRGYGAAVRSGLRRAHHDYVFLTDGDGQFDLRELEPAIAMLASHDVVVGYRHRRSDGPWRSLYGRAWTGLVNLALGLDVRDANCAFKLVPQGLLRTSELRSDGALISAELLAEARRADLRIAQCPVSHFPRVKGRQTGASLAVIGRAFLELGQYVAQRWRRASPGERKARTGDDLAGAGGP